MHKNANFPVNVPSYCTKNIADYKMNCFCYNILLYGNSLHSINCSGTFSL